MIGSFRQTCRLGVLLIVATVLICGRAGASEVPADEVPVGEVAVDEAPVDEVSVAEVAPDEAAVNETAVPSEEKPEVKAIPVNRSPWDLDPALESGLLLGSAILLSIDLVFKGQNHGPSCGAACNPMTLDSWERPVTGWYNPDAARASDVLLGVSIGLPLLAGLIDTGVSHPVDGWRGYGKDVLVLTETFALTTGVTNLLKYSIGRARPYAYNDSLPIDKRTEPDAGLSFPSGHTSVAFAMATSWSWLFMKRHPNSPAVIPIWIGSYAIAATTAVLRPIAGKHFWTDIIAGAALGISMGLLVPWLHELVAKKNRASERVKISVLPTVMEGGAGAVVTVTE
jgi:membrane-associated phospholipid phosphatase